MTIPRNEPGLLPAQQKRRSTLLKAAETVFLRDGFHATTMDAVAKTAAMSKKTIYQIFDSKEQLFEALLNERVKPLQIPVPEEGRAPKAVLTELLLVATQYLLEPSSIALHRLIMTEFARSPALAEIIQNRGAERGEITVEKWLSQLAGQGLYKIDNAHEAVKMLLGMTAGDFMTSLLLGRKRRFSNAVIRKRVEASVEIFLSGVTIR